jgi:hypothetical protein
MPGIISALTRVFDALWPGMTSQHSYQKSSRIGRPE